MKHKKIILKQQKAIDTVLKQAELLVDKLTN